MQTQVLPYLRELRKDGVDVELLTFEPGWPQSWTAQERATWQAKLATDGIRWHARTYHKRPSLPATLYDIATGAWHARRIVKQTGAQVLHARSHVAAAVGALAKALTGAKLLFDIRGFMAEEYVDAGVWPADGLLFRLTKAAERKLLRSADAYVVLTEKARQILLSETAKPFAVIPCCVDAGRFAAAATLDREAIRGELGLSGRRVLVYVGALGGWYLTEELAEFLATAHAQDPQTFSLILTQSPPEKLTARLQALGVQPENVLVRGVPPAEVPRYLKAADVALSFIKPCFSKLSSSPTKIAEYLASGLPVVSNAGIGDVDEMILGARVGVILREFTPAAYQTALAETETLLAEADLAARCQTTAQTQFDLGTVGGARYRGLYRRLLAK